MGLKHYVLNLRGVAQRLSDVYGDGVGVVNAAHDIPYRQIRIQPFEANTNIVYVGASSAVSASNYGIHLDPDDAWTGDLGLGPFETGPVKFSDIWVFGTLNEDISVLAVPF
jgi:hypothetical protein